MPLDSRGLRSYLAVCRAGSISAASRVLNISQPSVSVTIAQLEQYLGVQLFVRARSGIQLTAEGRALWRKAEAMETLLAHAEQEVALAARDVAGPLIVGGTPGALASLVPGAVLRLRHRFPRFQLEIQEQPDAALFDLLRNERIEFAFVTTGIDPVPDDIIEESISSDPFNLIVGAANAHLPDRVRLADLGNMAWALPNAVGAFRRQLDALFLAAQTPTPIDTIRCDSLLTLKSIVVASGYVTILPRQVAASELASGLLRGIEIADAEVVRTVGLRWLASRPLSPMATALLEATRELRED